MRVWKEQPIRALVAGLTQQQLQHLVGENIVLSFPSNRPKDKASEFGHFYYADATFTNELVIEARPVQIFVTLVGQSLCAEITSSGSQ